MRNTEKKTACILAALILGVLLCGCGDEIPDLTPEQQETITDYSVMLLMKYDKNSPGRLMPENSVTHIDFVDPATGTPAEIMPEAEPLDIAVDSEPAYTSEGTSYSDTVTGQSSEPVYAEGFESFLGGENIGISYAGHFDVLDSYPDGDDANPFLSIEASSGNKLVVVHFDVSNTSADTVSVNMGRLGLRYRISVNGGSNKYVMTTLLQNDLMSYVGDLGAGETVDLVAVCEVSAAEAEAISTLDFTIKGDDHTSVIKIQ